MHDVTPQGMPYVLGKKQGANRLLHAALNSWRGLQAAFTTEAAARQEIVALLVLSTVAIAVAKTAFMAALIIASMLAVLITELLNTAIEKLCDRITRAHDKEIGIVKDIGSAAVLVALCASCVIWIGAVAEKVMSA